MQRLNLGSKVLFVSESLANKLLGAKVVQESFDVIALPEIDKGILTKSDTKELSKLNFLVEPLKPYISLAEIGVG